MSAHNNTGCCEVCGCEWGGARPLHCPRCEFETAPAPPQSNLASYVFNTLLAANCAYAEQLRREGSVPIKPGTITGATTEPCNQSSGVTSAA